ncbi:MAG: hypothetical protein JNJ63_05920 [Hyphomonadaceae bacterium]|nr:hypothetical protein [Hyphomonadaceae bacterium]
MKKCHIFSVLAVIVGATVASALLTTPRASAQDSPRASKPGEGVICAWALYTVASEVGRRCHPGEDVELQEELERAVSQIDAYVVANTNPHVTQQQLHEFKRQQGHVGDSEEFLCHGDAHDLYRSSVEQGASAIRAHVENMISRPGEPTWGTCL